MAGERAEPTLAEALRAGALTLDGGLGTRLETRGNDVTGSLWSAEVLRSRPEEVRAAHADYFSAGARIATSCSYQVTADGFARAGLPAHEAATLLARSVELAREAADAPAEASVPGEPRWVLASIGPYGAARADGSEYTGDYGSAVGVAELRAWHRPRLRALDAAGADALLCETIPSLTEAEALAAELAECHTPGILSVSLVDGKLPSGDSPAAVARLAARTRGLIAVGVNCCAAADAAAALREMREACALPLVVYPNSGEQWHADTRSWSGSSASLAGHVAEWAAIGARLIGGCCRVDVDELGQISAAVARWNRERR
ncbi:homocysteine S-methyltransferase [Leucobacter massiliensis]|uniref:Homocysteine S-methyltransferase n=1 Tax=Leucobacter massiliensis TaxID=1686285 RepID=A0A2S9QRF8_9MICO|nr:homocysteine S-methyltransferase [Leucobacter massiliensis]PRI12174.1 homocysteine S-methyltransferase [Leucobacter massiliensis]